VRRREGGSARKHRAQGYPAHARLSFGTFSHGRCVTCGKLNYSSRHDAKEAARVYHPNDNGLRPYRCPEEGSSQWHYGHIPEWKIQGYSSAYEWRKAQEQEGEQA
jgi:hypothetical protein